MELHCQYAYDEKDLSNCVNERRTDFITHAMSAEEQFQTLVDRFGLKKSGASPFDAELLDANFNGASHGEKVSIAFLLNVWNPGKEWKAGKFDAIDALTVWGKSERQAFCDWAMDPWWP